MTEEYFFDTDCNSAFRADKHDILFRQYRETDCPAMAQLFYDTVHTVNVRDYTQKQVEAWADGNVDIKAWHESFLSHHTVVAEKDDVLVGFGDMAADGYLDRLYVHRDFQGQHIASQICDRLEKACKAFRFTTHASITARGFFEKRGYHVVKEQQVERRGIELTNFVMEKDNVA